MTVEPTASPTPIGTFCLVLHSHLPWLAHHGAWPVGEEWLYQAWAHAYVPLVELLEQLAAEGRRNVLTLGVSPILAAQLDDPYCLRAAHQWLGDWHVRSQLLADDTDTRMRALAPREYAGAARALEIFEARWRHGFSPVLRPLVDAGVVELLSGPVMHPFQPLLQPRLRDFALRTGLDDAQRRLGHRPAGIWAPECGYEPGMEDRYAAAGVRRFLVDGPALRGDTAAARPVAGTDVVCFGRDLEITYRVWSPRSGYPGHHHYRDFHTFHHRSGLKLARVTGRSVAPPDKRPYDPELATAALHKHVGDFVARVRARLAAHAERTGRPGLVVAAYDTELFGHWWHEGTRWLAAVLRALPEAGVRVSTLDGALRAGHLGSPAHPPRSSWGSGKDWRVWDGEQVADLAAANATLQRQLLGGLDGIDRTARDPVADQALRSGLLALASDWAFMVSKDSAADYARRRTADHAEDAIALLRARDEDPPGARELALRHRAVDGPFGQLDARELPSVP